MTPLDALSTKERTDLQWLMSKLGWLAALTEGTIDTFDPWGSALSTAFDVADELTRRGSEVPSEWEFRPGVAHEYEERALWIGDHTTDEYLVLVGNVALDVVRRAEAFGFSY